MSQNRREFLGVAAGVGLTLWEAAGVQAADKPIIPTKRKADEPIRFACIGVGGKGESDSNDAGRLGEVVAICDVDENTLKRAKSRRFPDAKVYTDYRQMFAEMAGEIDAVTVTTPDHHHASAALRAMALGKHTFCQKPLTRTIAEARKMADMARKMRVATQMGNQGTADSRLRRNAARLRAGLVGHVTELHIWTNRPIWPQGGTRAEPQPVPPGVHWDTWIGPAPERPYAPGYHTFAWRGWWDFGGGALGDMGCHTLNMPFMGLDLRNPISVEAKTSGSNHDSFPSASEITYIFGKTKNRPAIKMVWYDGGKMPDPALFDGRKLEESGAIVLGDKGKLYIPGDYAGDDGVLIGGVEIGEVTYPESPGHFEEFIRAIRTGEPAMSNFPGYAGPLAEMVLLGNLAIWAEGHKLDWDVKRMRVKNLKGLEPLIHGTYRKGWELPR